MGLLIQHLPDQEIKTKTDTGIEKCRFFLQSSFCFFYNFSLAQGEGERRNGRLFFVSSSSTTSTISTSTLCYVTTANNLATCAGVAGRKRRAIAFKDPNNDADVAELNPNPMEDSESSYEKEEVVESGKMESSPFRDPKFLLYWMTTTSTSTTTTFTSTFTLSELNCTPTGFTLSACG